MTTTLWTQMRYLNPYEIHKLLINEYMLRKPGDTACFKRDTSRDKNDLDVIRENHKFLWNENDTTDSWELQFAKKYYDKLFKEYCIGDLSLYKENKIALRWRTEKEVIVGKGQFICGNKKCSDEEGLRTWEVNFAYIEQGCKKNALVKIRLCPDCSRKLNYHSKKREVKRLKRSKYKAETHSSNRHSKSDEEEPSTSKADSNPINTEVINQSHDKNKVVEEDSLWENHKQIEPKTREDEMDEYLQDLLL